MQCGLSVLQYYYNSVFQTSDHVQELRRSSLERCELRILSNSRLPGVHLRYSFPAIFFFESLHQTISHSTNPEAQDTYKLPRHALVREEWHGHPEDEYQCDVAPREPKRFFQILPCNGKERMIQKEKDLLKRRVGRRCKRDARNGSECN
jgi:hypothetical protein